MNFSLFRNLSFVGIFLLLLFSGKLKAQDPFYLQKAMQSCLEHPEVKPNLRAVSFDDYKDVLVVARNSFTSADMKLIMFGKEVMILEQPALFFYGIENYVDLKEVQTEKDMIILSFTTGSKFTCTYSGSKDKVKKLNKLAFD